jgi:hypothetical protein
MEDLVHPREAVTSATIIVADSTPDLIGRGTAHSQRSQTLYMPALRRVMGSHRT